MKSKLLLLALTVLLVPQFQASAATPSSGLVKIDETSDLDAQDHIYVFTAKEVCQELFFDKSIERCGTRCLQGLATWNWKVEQASVVSGKTLTGTATVYCKGQGTYSCRGVQKTIFGETIDPCER